MGCYLSGAAPSLPALPTGGPTAVQGASGVSRTTLYKYVPELTVGRDALLSGDRGPALPGPR